MTKPVTVYGLADPRTGQVRYVGQSVDIHERYYRHVREASRTAHHTHKLHWIRGLLTLGLAPTLVLLSDPCSVDEADDVERSLIASLPDLTNAAEGGHVGSRGARWTLSPERRAQIAENNRRRAPMSAQGRANIAAGNRRRSRG